MGRPSSFTQEIADEICAWISSNSLGLRHLPDHLPHRDTVMEWAKKNKDFADQYARAMSDRADFMAEEILDIVDDGSNDLMTIVKGDNIYEQENKELTSRSKMRYEARRWLMGKLQPKKYGDKIEVEGLPTNEASAEALALIAERLNNNSKSNAGS